MTSPQTKRRECGVAVVGAGAIGRHRARLAAQHPAVGFLAIADIDGRAAERLATDTNADYWTTETAEVVAMSEIDAVVVATHEEAHTGPVVAALRAGKPTLVEKPIAMSLNDADEVLATATTNGVELRVGYSMRYGQRYAVAFDQIRSGRIGQLVGGLARTYDTVAVGEAILKRSPTATPAMDVLTYLVDVIGWYHQLRPVEVLARGHGRILRGRGHDADDLTFAMVTYEDGAVFDLGASYSLPAGYPIHGSAVRIELLGTGGALLMSEDHGDQILYSDSGYENEYVAQHLNLTFLGSRTSGEWVGDTMFGRVADETRAWLDWLTTGRPCHITTAAEARRTLQVTLAIDESARSGWPVMLEG